MTKQSAPDFAARVRRAFENVSRWMNRCAGWVYVGAAIFITADVLSRQFLGFSSKSTVELTGYLLAIGISWGLGFALVGRAHVRFGGLINRLPLALRRALHAFASLLLAWFGCFLA